MPMNGFFTSDITSQNKEAGGRTRLDWPFPRLPLGSRTAPPCSRVTTQARRMKHSSTNLVKSEITEKIIVIKLIAVVIS